MGSTSSPKSGAGTPPVGRTPSLLLITDVSSCRRHGRSVVATLARVCAGGIDGDVAVVLRHLKNAPTDQLQQEVPALVSMVRQAGARVFLHGRPDLVASLGVDGVHLASNGDVLEARRLLGPAALLGWSRHPEDSAPKDHERVLDAVDYLTWSPVFTPSSKVDGRTPLGVEALGGHRRPVLALGGITASRVESCLAAGAAGVAVSGSIFGAADPRAALMAVLGALRSHRRRHGVHGSY